MAILNTAPFLTAKQIGDLASTLDVLHQRALKTIARLQADVAARKLAIASRWKNSPGLSAGDMSRFAQQETLASVREIRDVSQAELDKIIKDAGTPHAALIAQRPFYDSPVKVLARAALGDPKRTEYLQQLAYAGPAELSHMAQLAVSTSNVALASAVLSRLDAMPSKDRAVSPQELASAMQLEDFTKVREYLKIGDARLQGILVAIRAWNAGKANPLNTLALAMREKQIDAGVLEGLSHAD